MPKKSSKKESLRGMSRAELDKKLRELRESLRMIKFKGEGAKSKNVKETRNMKKEIARILTEINKQK